MPKKTRRQKILAEKHQNFSFSPPVFTYDAKSVTASPSVHASPTGMNYIKRDMFKTIAIGVIFIILEFILAGFIGRS